MVICHERKFIFFHIPKCGGTSVEKALFVDKYKKNELYGYHNRNGDQITLQHLTYRKLKELGLVDESKLKEYYKFAVIRNPYEKLVSDYCWMSERKIIPDGYSFTDFVTKDVNIVVTQKRYYEKIFHDHLIPQVHFITDENMIIRMNDVIRLENLNDFFKQKFPNSKLEHHNKSTGHDFLSYYNYQTLSVVNRLYQEDFTILGYPMIQPNQIDLVKYYRNPKPMNSNITCFIHACTLNNGLEILCEQINLIISTNLYDKANRIMIGIVGPILPENEIQLDNLILDYSKIQIIHRNPDPKVYEHPTLNYLHQFAKKNSNSKILYIHTKGAHPRNQEPERASCVRDWRKLLEYFLVEQHQNCLTLLDNNSTVSALQVNNPWPHYKGNFWWANGTYLSELTDLSKFRKLQQPELQERMYAEKWLLSSPRNSKFYYHCNLYDSGIKHYRIRYPREKYAE